jgi:lipopolysaccharide/colanic/teichoic acid biosynthesis glycosyltransferase
MIFLFPFLALIVIAIFIDGGGPVLYKSSRVGKGGRRFEMYKFRTMRGDGSDTSPRVTAHDDPRVTRLGRFLRATKINEMPQLLNVIKGDMSIVGPRPEDPEFASLYPIEQNTILSIRPGITSPASVIYYDEERLLSFSKATDSYVNAILPRKLRLDLLYVRHHSFLLDMDVLFRTLLYYLPKMRAIVPRMDEILFGPVQRLFRRHIPWFVIDWIIGLMALGAAGIIWRLRIPLDVGAIHSLIAALVFASAFSLTNFITGVYRTDWNRASGYEAVEITFSASLATLLLIPADKYLFRNQLFPSGMILLACMFALIGFTGVRYRQKILQDLANRWVLENENGSHREKVLIVGAGDSAELVIRVLQSDPRGRAYKIVGLVDDNPQKGKTRFRGVNVLGSTRRIEQIVRDHSIDVIIFAIHNMETHAREKVLQVCRNTKARVINIPDIGASLYADLASGHQKHQTAKISAESKAGARKWRTM